MIDDRGTPDHQPDDGTTRPTRRTVLRAAGIGAVIIAGGLTWRAADQGVFTPLSGPAYAAWSGEHRGLARLAAAAVLAASAHNMQNWLMHLARDHIDLRDDTSRSLGALDPYRREARLSLGCALANLELTGPPNGYSTHTTLTPDPADDTLVARVRLSSTTPGGTDPLHEAITERHSDRGPYPTEPVDPGILEAATSAATAGSRGARIRWLTDLDAAGALVVEATEALIADEPMSAASAAWFRNGPDQVARMKDGLTLDAQALPALIELAGKMLPPVPRSRSDATWVQTTRDTHTATARGYAAVLAGPTVPDRVDAGRVLQRLHLALTSHGLAMQHLNQAHRS